MSKDQNISDLLSSVTELDEDNTPKNGEATAQHHGTYGDPYLRDMQIVLGYQARALDGIIGIVENFVIDESTWRIQFIVVNGKQTAVNKTVLVPPEWVVLVEWANAGIYADLYIDTLKESPDFDLSSPIDREI